MALPYRFGLGLPTNGPFANRDGLLRSARRAEAVGLDDVWTNDFLDFGRSRITRSTAGTYEAARGQDPNFFEGVATIALLAGALRKIGVGIGSLAAQLSKTSIALLLPGLVAQVAQVVLFRMGRSRP